MTAAGSNIIAKGKPLALSNGTDINPL